MIYELKHFDKTVLKFSALDNSNDPDIKITWIDDDKTLLSLDLDVSDEGLFVCSCRQNRQNRWHEGCEGILQIIGR